METASSAAVELNMRARDDSVTCTGSSQPVIASILLYGFPTFGFADQGLPLSGISGLATVTI